MSLASFIGKKLYSIIFWRTDLGEILGALNDVALHLKFSFQNNRLSDKENLYFYLTKQYHIIEKGLALPNPKPGFAEQKILDLIEKTKLYLDKYGYCQLIGSIKQTLTCYLSFNKRIGASLPVHLSKSIDNLLNQVTSDDNGGVKLVTKVDIQKSAMFDFENFVMNRFSVRDFSDVPVDDTLVKRSIDYAKFAPSVCNRQGWLAHYYTDKIIIKKLLDAQGGNGGFTQCIDKLLIVTGNIKAFTKHESNQLFTDGGLFSMNLILALHANGLSSCALNTCFTYPVETNVKKMAGIPKNERLIMMLAVGNLKDKFMVAVSSRRNTDEILIKH